MNSISFISFIHIINVYISVGQKHWDGLVTKYDKIRENASIRCLDFLLNLCLNPLSSFY